MVDFSTTDSTPDSARSYRIDLPPLQLDRAYFFKAGNRQIVIIRRSAKLVQAQSSAARKSAYFVAYALGTNLGCPLQVVDGNRLKESCSSAMYDFSGQPVGEDKNFTALHVPVYNFCDNFSCINLRI